MDNESLVKKAPIRRQDRTDISNWEIELPSGVFCVEAASKTEAQNKIIDFLNESEAPIDIPNEVADLKTLLVEKGILNEEDFGA